jgi:hypothetical protein
MTCLVCNYAQTIYDNGSREWRCPKCGAVTGFFSTELLNTIATLFRPDVLTQMKEYTPTVEELEALYKLEAK